MNSSTFLRRLLATPPAIRSTLLPLPRTASARAPSLQRTYTSSTVASKGFWVNLVPKPLRNSSPRSALKKKVKSKEWNPATFFIIIFLLVGSMSIQMIALRNEFTASTRRADARIGLLKEIIERIQNGEEVDVEGLLGTGNPQREEEWEQVLREIEQEDEALQKSREHNTRKQATSKEDISSRPEAGPSTPESAPQVVKSGKPVGFY